MCNSVFTITHHAIKPFNTECKECGKREKINMQKASTRIGSVEYTVHCIFLCEILGTMFSKIYKAVYGGVMLVYL